MCDAPFLPHAQVNRDQLALLEFVLKSCFREDSALMGRRCVQGRMNLLFYRAVWTLSACVAYSMPTKGGLVCFEEQYQLALFSAPDVGFNCLYGLSHARRRCRTVLRLACCTCQRGCKHQSVMHVSGLGVLGNIVWAVRDVLTLAGGAVILVQSLTSM